MPLFSIVLRMFSFEISCLHFVFLLNVLHCGEGRISTPQQRRMYQSQTMENNCPLFQVRRMGHGTHRSGVLFSNCTACPKWKLHGCSDNFSMISFLVREFGGSGKSKTVLKKKRVQVQEYKNTTIDCGSAQKLQERLSVHAICSWCYS